MWRETFFHSVAGRQSGVRPPSAAEGVAVSSNRGGGLPGFSTGGGVGAYRHADGDFPVALLTAAKTGDVRLGRAGSYCAGRGGSRPKAAK